MLEDDSRLDARATVRDAVAVWRARFAPLTLLGLLATFGFAAGYAWLMGMGLQEGLGPIAATAYGRLAAWLSAGPLGVLTGLCLCKIVLAHHTGAQAAFSEQLAAIREHFGVWLGLSILLSGGYYLAALLSPWMAALATVGISAATARWSVAPMVNLVEGTGIGGSLARSAQLTRPFLGSIVVLWVLLDLARYGLSWIAWPQAFDPGAQISNLSYWLLMPLADAAGFILMTATAAVLYLALRRAEGAAVEGVFD
jgi:hypothetical protein